MLVCSLAVSSPSSSMSPSTTNSLAPGVVACLAVTIRAAVSSAARVESGLALYASLTIVTPSDRSSTSMRHGERGGAEDNAVAMTSRGRPSATAAPAAHTALLTMWTVSYTHLRAH